MHCCEESKLAKYEISPLKFSYFWIVSCTYLLLPVADLLITDATFKGKVIRNNSFIYDISKTHGPDTLRTVWADGSVTKKRDQILKIIRPQWLLGFVFMFA